MEKAFKHRVNAGKTAVLNQVDIFHNLFAQVHSEWKEDDSRVTFADFSISENISRALRNDFPRDDFFSEESMPGDEGWPLNGGYAWVLDPIDGTNNYALGLPVCAISLALLKEGVPVYGFIYDLSRRRLLHGGPGLGLRDGSRKTSVKTSPPGAQSLVGLHFPLNEEDCRFLRPLMTQYRVRSLGSAALNLAYAAAGILDGCVDFKVKVWDIAAAHALILAGGGQFHFIEEPVFPLRIFQINAPPIRCYAGSPPFCEWVAGMLLQPNLEPARKTLSRR